MGKMKNISIMLELVRNNAHELLRLARAYEKGNLQDDHLPISVVEIAIKILNAVNEK